MTTVPYRSTKEAIASLGSLARRKAPLSMSHPYRGMLLTENLFLVSLGAEQVLVQASRNWLATNPGDRIYLHSKATHQVWMARVLGVNIQQGEMALGDFEETGHPWTERMNERVQPRAPVHLLLRTHDHCVTASLENISLHGAGVQAYKLAERGINLEAGQPIRLDFDLPGIRARISLPARLVNYQSHGKCVCCLGVSTFPNVDQSRTLERYITHRKAEILDELDQSLSHAFEPQSVKDLYF